MLLKGSISSDLEYPISVIHNVHEGRWELCISSVAFEYTANTQPAYLELSTNFVMGQFVNSRQEPYSGQAVLNLCLYGGKRQGSTTVIGMKQQTFFAVNNAQQILKLSLKESKSGKYPSGSNVNVLLLLRRVA